MVKFVSHLGACGVFHIMQEETWMLSVAVNKRTSHCFCIYNKVTQMSVIHFEIRSQSILLCFPCYNLGIWLVPITIVIAP